MGAMDAWKRQVEAHHEQSIRIQQAGGWSPEGHAESFADLFIADPRRTDDPILNRLYEAIPPGASVLDVGGGAGRYALPLALRGHRVTVVEPSGAMLERLRAGMREVHAEVAIVQANWEDAVVKPADVVLAAHVVYGVSAIGPFLRKLQDHARRLVLLPAFMQSPPSQFAPLWPVVHGEERINLPALPELLPTLWEMEVYPDLVMFSPEPAEMVHGREAGLALLRRFLFVRPGTEQEHRLETAMDEWVVETPRGVSLRGSRPRRQGLLSWRPAGAG